MKNLKIKLFLEKYILPSVSKVNAWMKHANHRVLFYINSDFRENNKVLFDYMIEHGYNERYKIVVACYDYKKYRKKRIENVHFINTRIATFEFFLSRYIFYSIGKIPLYPAKDQIVMQMWHGVPLKAADEGLQKQTTLPFTYYTWVLSTSEYLKPVFSSWLSCPQKNIYVGGYPRCDYLFQKEKEYDFGDYHKLILWAPTFRKSKIRGYTDTEMHEKIVPILSNDYFSIFNDHLKKINIKIIVKLHPAQDLSNYNLLEMENLILLSHEDFVKKGLDLYKLAAQSDALITDYSSIYFDYLLTNRPVGFTIDDIEEYRGNRGFSLDPNKFMPGMKMAKYEDMVKFVQDVADNKDPYREERQKITPLINQDCNGGYSQKILDFVGIQ